MAYTSIKSLVDDLSQLSVMRDGKIPALCCLIFSSSFILGGRDWMFQPHMTYSSWKTQGSHTSTHTFWILQTVCPKSIHRANFIQYVLYYTLIVEVYYCSSQINQTTCHHQWQFIKIPPAVSSYSIFFVHCIVGDNSPRKKQPHFTVFNCVKYTLFCHYSMWAHYILITCV